MKVVTIDQMRQLEEVCAKIGLPAAVLMENAGRATAEQVLLVLESLDVEHILILAGPGNNGGDGLVVARYLSDWGAGVSVCLVGSRPEDDANLMTVREREITCIAVSEETGLGEYAELLSSATAVVDALFGTGRSRPLEGVYRQALEAVGAARRQQPSLHLFALDVPSGLDADTGEADPACLDVDDTIALGFPKIGLFNASGAEKAGHIDIVDIGIPPDLAESVTVELISGDWVASTLPKRPLTANKGTFGRLLVVAGSTRYVGAAYLACAGAMRVGTGLVTLATAASLQPVLAGKLTEATYLPLPEAGPGAVSAEAAKVIAEEGRAYDAMLIGCGLGQEDAAAELVQATVLDGERRTPLVVDADALNILSRTPDWWQRLPDDAILTPHPGEMSRLAGMTVGEIQADRCGAARRKAQQWQKTVVLKGAYTVIAAPDGMCRISPVANPGLASAGTGDVLAGVIAGLRAQGLPAAEAAACGVFLHAAAGEAVRTEMGDTGMLAGDLLPELPLTIRRLKEDHPNGLE